MQVYLPIAELSVNLFFLVGIGGAVGFLSGLFGIGGGFLLTPLLIFSGVPSPVAVASVTGQVVAASTSGALSHYRRGGIDLHLPSGLGADVEAETVNGGIRNDFGLPVHKGKWVGSDMRGTIGGGGIDISLETVNGGIRLHAD